MFSRLLCALALALTVCQTAKTQENNSGKGKRAQQTPPTTAQDWLKILDDGSTQSNLGQFLGGKRFGFEIANESPVLWNGKLSWRVVEESAREELADGKIVSEVIHTTSVHSLEGNGPLVYFHQVILSYNGVPPEYETTQKNLVEKNDAKKNEPKKIEKVAIPREDGLGLKLTVNREGRIETRNLNTPKASLAQAIFLKQWLASRPEPGSKITSWETDWEDQNPDHPTTNTFLGREFHEGKIVNRMRCELDGARMECLIADDGKTIAARLGPLILKQETEQLARQIQGPVDLGEQLSIPLEGLGNPKVAPRMTKATWRMEGLEGTGFIFTGDQRQVVKASASNAKGIVDLVTYAKPAKVVPEPLDEETRKQMLASTPSLQAEDPRLKAWALAQVGKAQSVNDKAALLVGAVNSRLVKTMAANAEDALTVLDQAKGDCTEHSLLFVAAARACGIPAREVTGLVPGEIGQKNGTKLAMVWHAWAEYHDGTSWRPVDPTWNQAAGVDATHVKLATGTGDWAWMNLLGSLKVHLVEYQAP